MIGLGKAETQTWDPKPGVRSNSVSVSIIHPGNRVEKMLKPLQTTDLDVSVAPPNPYDRDVVIADNADTDLGKEVLKNKLTDSMLVYRMRGDLFRELDLWDMHPVKRWAAERVPKFVDAIVAVTDFLALKAARKTGVPAGQAGMWIRPDEYPDTQHLDHELRAVTLTNANYIRKVRPIATWADTVESELSKKGGEWRIFGKGSEADYLSDQLESYSHVHFEGFTATPKDQLDWANLMLHPSNLDGQPNAVIEGLASGLPVLTTDFIAFEELQLKGAPINPVKNPIELQTQLDRLQKPSEREPLNRNGPAYCRENHTPEEIGRHYQTFLTNLVDQ